MQKLTIGDVTITSIIEREGPWRKPEDMFPAYDPEIGRRHLAELDPVVFDPASGRMVITYQTFLVRTPKHTVLIDTCTGEDKGHPPSIFPSSLGSTIFARPASASRTSRMCSAHLHIDHTPAGTRCCATGAGCRPSESEIHLPQGRIRLGGDDEKSANPPGNVWTHNCRPIVEPARRAGRRRHQLDGAFSLTPTPGIRRTTAASTSARRVSTPW
jgi:hypothetical protein